MLSHNFPTLLKHLEAHETKYVETLATLTIRLQCNLRYVECKVSRLAHIL